MLRTEGIDSVLSPRTSVLFSRFTHRACEGGAEGQNRTVDTSLFRAVLCQLSYLGTGATIASDLRMCQAGLMES